jgi:hypothetical protein
MFNDHQREDARAYYHITYQGYDHVQAYLGICQKKLYVKKRVILKCANGANGANEAQMAQMLLKSANAFALGY